ncbi:Helix-turn-helix domain-containing protein [Amycolatopsis sacchari]|uniref:Helix-turn-helix domain-containing protein n=1 Tax=Amycolatopsis sacchari TaxID=115433 RepID=A0A1I3UHM2_9PSEU|nr:helix-turn-helix domain-containing protein [Amycolatopsis sacchari]SFJ82984.1 Helix-turn-helix domain-containing protein [Amycolatopsis sacchari]
MNLAELGVFLRSRRARIRPDEVGLPGGPRRRVPGLRRDEVANLAGASVDYYTELERGRGAQPSAQMLAALARALRLDSDERAHLFHLAGRPVPPPHGHLAHVQPAMLDLLGRLTGTPAQIITDLHETLVQNPLAVALLGAHPRGGGFEASFAYRWFTDPAARAVYPPEDHQHQSEAFAADLRAALGRRGRDRHAEELVARLRRLSTEFEELWARGDVAVRRRDSKRIVHPEVGVLDLDCLTLLSEDGRQRLLWFVPRAGTDAADRLRLLEVVGSQELGSTR